MEADSIPPWLVPGLVQQRACLGRVKRILRSVCGIGPMLWRQDTVRQSDFVAPKILRQRLAIDSVRQRLAHSDLSQYRIAQVHPDVSVDRALRLLDLEPTLAADGFDRVGGERV